jgi:hypothetical protein
MQVGAKMVHLRVKSEPNLQDTSWSKVGEDWLPPCL